MSSNTNITINEIPTHHTNGNNKHNTLPLTELQFSIFNDISLLNANNNLLNNNQINHNNNANNKNNSISINYDILSLPLQSTVNIVSNNMNDWNNCLSVIINSAKFIGLAVLHSTHQNYLFKYGIINNITNNNTHHNNDNDLLPVSKIFDILSHITSEKCDKSVNVNGSLPVAKLDNDYTSFNAFGNNFIIYFNSFTSFYSICKYKRVGLLVHKLPFGVTLISIYTKPYNHANIIPFIEKQIQLLKV